MICAASASAQHSGHGELSAEKPASDLSPSARFRQEMSAGMSKMMKDMHAPGYSGNADIDFLAMMIPHHEGAVEMARLVLIHGRDPLTRRLAEDIIASQVVEIEAMKRRLELLKRAPQEREFPALGGTRGPVP
jgi:uncharacterized protein (DUF305 family)